MKHLFLLLPLTLFSVPVQAQQVNNFAVCTQNQEVYRPGGYDRYGNYYPGGVSVQTYNVPCNGAANQYYGNGGGSGYYGRRTNPNCNPVRTLLGSVLGGAIGRAAASAYPDNYGWATAAGAAIGGLTFAC
ncbi:MAG: hypothetical protein EBU08_21375 [Micrococcales bacterium]|nr:hypothetical protein [Micrococcales bacterium]